VGTIYLGAASAAAPYKLGVTTDVGNLGPFVSVVGASSTGTFIKYYGTAQAILALNHIRASTGTFNTMFSQGAPYSLGSKFDRMTIDGSSAGAGAIGMDVGSFEGGILGDDLTIQNFTGAGSIGLRLNNQYSWTENWRGKANLYNNTSCVVFAKNGGVDASFGYNDLIFKVYCFANQTGIAITGGGSYYHGRLVVRGNFAGGATNTGSTLLLTGGSIISASYLDYQCESNVNIGGSVKHQTITFGVPGTDYILGCHGMLAWDSAQVVSNWTRVVSQPFGFDGYIIGDATLNSQAIQASADPNGTTLPTSTMARTEQQGISSTGSNVATIDLASGSIFNLATLSGSSSTVVSFVNGSTSTPRHIWVRVIQNSSLVNITWPTNGSPTGASPTVIWENLVPPVLTRVTNAVDYFEFWTFDGATWVGRQHPQVGTALAPVATNYGTAQSTSTSSLNTNCTALAIGSFVAVFVATPTPSTRPSGQPGRRSTSTIQF
jgi:hypothetical protein